MIKVKDAAKLLYVADWMISAAIGLVVAITAVSIWIKSRPLPPPKVVAETTATNLEGFAPNNEKWIINLPDSKWDIIYPVDYGNIKEIASITPETLNNPVGFAQSDQWQVVAVTRINGGLLVEVIDPKRTQVPYRTKVILPTSAATGNKFRQLCADAKNVIISADRPWAIVGRYRDTIYLLPTERLIDIAQDNGASTEQISDLRINSKQIATDNLESLTNIIDGYQKKMEAAYSPSEKDEWRNKILQLKEPYQAAKEEVSKYEQ